MQSLEINVAPPLPYRKRLRASLVKPMILTAVFACMAMGFKGLMHDYPSVQMALPFIVIILFVGALLLQYRWAEKEEFFFITSLKMSPEKVEITYTEKDYQKTASGAPEDFIFEKKATLSRTGSSYQQSFLNIFHHNKFVLRQYTSEEWTDYKFMEVVHAANK